MKSHKNSKDPVVEKVDWKSFSPGPIVGVDEVGRGCLAGPVFAAAVCFRSDLHTDGLTDSKLLSEKRRDEIAPLIIGNHWVGIGSASAEEIDQINILQASFLAMRRALTALETSMGVRLGHVLVDGNMRIPGIEIAQTPLIKGDLRCSPISAASIVAKVTRDRLMREMGERYPGYGFEDHKGYSAPVHMEAIRRMGPTPLHRKSFSGVKEFIIRSSARKTM